MWMKLADRAILSLVVVASLAMQSAPAFSASDAAAGSATSAAVAPNSSSRFRDCDECPEMVVVPPGRFTMGDDPNDPLHDSSALPPHEVAIAYRFAVGAFEVTFAEWAACVAGGGCSGYEPDDEGWGRERRPAIRISWQDARSYVGWLSSRTGQRYRLLTEAEWEYAARAGASAAYPGGPTPNRENANFGKDKCCRGFAEGKDAWEEGTAPVGSFAPNGSGLFDMSGNVWEWVEDCWNRSYDGAPTDGRPSTKGWATDRTTGDCSDRVARGGSWNSVPQLANTARRLWTRPATRSVSLGFRVARTL